MENNYRFQWFIITAIGGHEESIADALKEKITNYGYKDEVKEIKVFTKKVHIETIFAKDDPELPATLRNTKTIIWEVLPDGKYKRTKTKVVNRFSGYIFIQMDINREIWYTIRNTNGVLGFIGSTGKGSLPVPISIEEFEKIILTDIADEYKTDGSKSKVEIPSTPIQTAVTPKVEETKVTKEVKQETIKQEASKPTISPMVNYPFKVGHSVVITSGSFEDTVGNIVDLNLEKGIATIECEFFGRTNSFEISINDIKLID